MLIRARPAHMCDTRARTYSRQQRWKRDMTSIPTATSQRAYFHIMTYSREMAAFFSSYTRVSSSSLKKWMMMCDVCYIHTRTPYSCWRAFQSELERVRAVQFWGVTRCKGAEKVHEYVKRFKVVDLESPNLRTSLSIDVSLHYFLFVAYAARFLFFFVVQYIQCCLSSHYIQINSWSVSTAWKSCFTRYEFEIYVL